MPAVVQQIPIQRLNPENKGAFCLYTLASRLYKKQSLTYIWLYASLLATSPSVLCDLPYVQILSVLSPYVSPSSLPQNHLSVPCSLLDFLVP
jgi:hypothetical protein